jgi:stage II sporulation protein R
LDGIVAAAKEELAGNGSGYAVSASVGNFDFPTKRYDDLRLPAGNYDALRVVIGGGEGENWWCVLFPRLCFTGSGNGNGTLSNEARQRLKNVLTAEEYHIVADSEDGNLPVKIKFRLLEIFGR